MSAATMRHRGRCGRRVQCWRPECRDTFGKYPTIEILPDKAMAYCHRLQVPLDDPRLMAVAA